MYDDEQVKEKGGGVKALATFIVDKRNLFFLLYIFAFVFCFSAEIGFRWKTTLPHTCRRAPKQDRVLML